MARMIFKIVGIFETATIPASSIHTIREHL